MYSLVLMMALSNGAATPAWQDVGVVNKTYADHGTREFRHGCRGGCGGCWGGCWGYSCCGCCGGCWGGCYGCWGGCYGCWGGCWGGGYAMYPSYGGGYRAYYDGYSMPATYGEPSYRYEERRDNRRDQDNRPRDRGDRGSGPEAFNSTDRATLVVSLPADAQLMIDGQPTRSTSNTRIFVSPALQPGAEYYYTLKAQLRRNNQDFTVTRDVRVQPGQRTMVTLDFSRAEVARR